MKYRIATYEGTKYLHITRSASTRLEDIKASRRDVHRLLHMDAIERVMSDCREVDFEGASVLEIDTLAKDLKDDIPTCKRLAVIAQPNTSGIFPHFKNLCSFYGVEVRFFVQHEPAEAWLCGDLS